MRYTFKSVIGILTLIAASSAHASVLVSSIGYGYGSTATNTMTFDDPAPSGLSLLGGEIQAGSNARGAAPALSATVRDSSAYLTVMPGEIATISSNLGFKAVSFYWGSIDAYNTVTLLGKNGAEIASYMGNQIADPANGDQWAATTNQRVTFTTDGSTSAIYGVKFTSSQPAFEVDNVSFSSPVPEASTWAMMIVGFGIIGFVARRRTLTSVSVTYA